MSGNNFEIKSDIDSESLLLETDQSLKEFKQEIQDKNQYFEYKNRSKDGKWYVFSYNAITGERTDDIKQKYIDQYKYKGEKEEIIITDDKGNEILSKEFRENTKIYLKIKRNENRRPVLFINYNFSKDNDNIVCYIDADGWTPHNIRQIYQDQADKVIPEEYFLIQDGNGKTYDESARFKPGDAVIIKFKKSETSEKDSHGEKYTEEKVEENNEAEEVEEQTTEEVEEQTTEEVEEQTTEEHTQETPEEATQETAEAKISIFREMIETQGIPLSRGDRSKPEISLTFDDGYGESYIRSILDTLRGSGIKATFFVLGECVKKSRSLWEQAIKDGHEICCHTYSHAYLSEGENTELFKGHGISPERRPGLIKAWDKNVKRLLGMEYYNKIKAENPGIPEVMDSATLLETELLMWEEEVRQSLGEAYLEQMKLNHPFFRFPGGCGSKRMENIEVLKEHGYLAIGWNDEPKYKMPEKVGNGDIPLFHFDQKNISALNPYISKIKSSGKKTKLISELLLQ